MSNRFYIIVDGEQKGPFGIEDLQSNNLSADSYIWCPGMDNWKCAKDVDELKFLFSKEQSSIDLTVPVQPPPFQHPENTTSIPEEPVSNLIEEKPFIKPPAIKHLIGYRSKVLIGFISLFLAGLAIIVLVVLFFTNDKRDKLRADIQTKVDAVFQDRSVIQDGYSFDVDGDFELVTNNDNTSIDLLFKQLKLKDPGKKIYATFTPKFIGGAHVKTLFDNKKNNNEEGYTLITTEGKEIDFYAPVNKSYVETAYKGVLDYYKEQSYFTPGKMDNIRNFEHISNDYYFIDNYEDITYLQDGKETKKTKSSIYNSLWSVTTYSEGERFRIEEWSYRVKKDFLTQCGYIGGGYFLLSLVLLIFMFPSIRTLILFNKEWKSQSNSHLLIFNHHFFKDSECTEILNDQVAMGKLKITEGGKRLNLIFGDRVDVYQIVKMDSKHLCLYSMKNKNNLDFIF